MKKTKASCILRSAFDRLKKQNSSVSMRGLAIRLKVSHPFLSKMISGKSAVPQSRFKEIAKAFQLDAYASRELRDAMIEDLSATEKAERLLNRQGKQKKKAIAVYEERPIKHMTLLANWYDIPVWDYLTCVNVPKSAQAIADRLAITPEMATRTLRKLSDAKLIERDENGDWKKATQYVRFPSVAPSGVLKSYYTDVLKRATQELSRTSPLDFERRLIINFSIATSNDRIPEIKERLS
ncbi:MAG: TIGR02147 family protein, partial [Bdellovibrionales bacterium]|nr:TIGR02147 family protein [Bdellovibrionales bacterium]